jgi:hypothetical protein
MSDKEFEPTRYHLAFDCNYLWKSGVTCIQLPYLPRIIFHKDAPDYNFNDIVLNFYVTNKEELKSLYGLIEKTVGSLKNCYSSGAGVECFIGKCGNTCAVLTNKEIFKGY